MMLGVGGGADAAPFAVSAALQAALLWAIAHIAKNASVRHPDFRRSPPRAGFERRCRNSRDHRPSYSSGIRFAFSASHCSNVCSAGFSDRASATLRLPTQTSWKSRLN